MTNTFTNRESRDTLLRGFAVGLSVCTGIGVIVGDLGTWIAVGVAVGIALGAGWSRKGV